MGEAVAARMEIEQRLRLAIRDRRFCCAFQPKIDIRHQQVVGFEALVRWRDEYGVIQAPGSFVGIATELGLLDQITRFVLGDAIDALEPLDRRFGSDTTISINVAAKQAGDLQFMRSFADAIARHRTRRPVHAGADRGRFRRDQRLFQTRSPADPARGRRAGVDRRFRHRLLVPVGARRHHGRRDQGRPLLHHGDPPAPAQPERAQGDRIAEPRART